MKRISLLTAFTLVLCSLLCFSMNAFANPAEDFDYYEDNGGIIITGCYADGDVEIPAQIDGLDVVAIDEYAFMALEITSVTFPPTVTSIGEGAFWMCSSLTEVVLPDNLETIGGMAFLDCESLAKVTISYLVSEIGDEAFEGCSDELVIYGYTGSYAEVYAKNNDIPFESIGDSPSVDRFSGTCGDNLTWTIDNTNTLTVTGTGAMKDSDTFWWDYRDIIQAVVIEEGVTSILKEAFYNCSLVESVTLPSTLVSIGDHAFWRCSALTSINFPQGLKEIGLYSFEQCSSITSVILPEGLTKLGAFAFSNCTSMTEVYVPSTVETLDNSTFYRCTSLKNITLNSGLKNIKNNVFSYCYFESIVLPSTLEAIGNYAFDQCGQLKELQIPSTVKTIGEYAFRSCKKLSSVNIPDGVTRIERSTFEGCSVLKDINIPSSVTVICNKAFYNCKLIDTVGFGDYFGSIGDYAFYGTAIKSVTIPAGVGEIGDGAFPASMEKIIGYDDSVAEEYASDNGIEFESLGEAPDYVLAEGTCGDNLEWSVTTRGVLTITGEGEAYNYTYSDRPWKGFAVKKLVLGEGITYIGQYMFCECAIEEVVIPDTVVEIGSNAFYYCENLKSVTFNEGLVWIMKSAFYGCYLLDTVQIPSTTVSIAFDDIGWAFDSEYLQVVKGYNDTAAEAFAESAGIEFVSLGETEEKVIIEDSLDSSASYTLTNKGKLNISSTHPTGIYYSSPWHNFNLITEIVIGDNITTLGSGISYVFYNCKYLTSMTISAHVTDINEWAIYNDDGVYNFKIYGYDGTAAQECAERLGVEFESLGEAPVIVVESGNCGANATWTLDTAGVLRISGTGKIYDYVNPWDSKYREEIKKIVVENGINNIPYRAFEYEYSAEEIEISYSVLSIEYLPDNITRIHGYNNTAAHKYATDNEIEFVSLGDAPDEPVAFGTAGASATWTLNAMGVLTLSGSGEVRDNYGNSPYEYYSDFIRKAVVEDGIETIGYNAFYYYQALEEVVLAESVTSIDMNAFAYCEALKSINLHDNITEINALAFGYCTSLTEVKLPLSLTAVSQQAFEGCSSLKSVTIQHNVYHIAGSAFSGCALESVIIPASVTSIYSGAFDSDVIIYGYDDTYAQTYAKYNYMTFVSLGRAPLYEPISGTVADLEWVLSTDGVMTITGNGKMEMPNRYDDFPWKKHVKYIDELVIGEGVTSVGYNAFYNCIYLEKVTLPESLLSIEANAFYGCELLASVTLPQKLEMVDSCAFYGTVITKMIVPESVTVFSDVFGYSKPNGLVIYGYTGSVSEKYAKQQGVNFVSIGVLERKVIKEGECGENLTWKLDNYGTLTIEGTGAMYDYTSDEAAPWRTEYFSEILVDEGVTSIGNYAFAYSNELTAVSLPSSLKVIGESAFSGCGSLTLVEIPEGTTEIGADAFLESSMAVVVVPESLTTIADTAFLKYSYSYGGNEYKDYCRIYGVAGGKMQQYCEKNGINFNAARASGKCGDNATWSVDVTTGSLEIKGTGATYDYDMNSAPWYAYNYEIRTVSISEGITSIGVSFMSNMGFINEIEIPSTVTAIGRNAFDNCWNLNTVVIHEGCKTIGSEAFSWCSELSEITIPASVTTIDDTAFAECENVVVYGAQDSEAQRIASVYGFDFVDVYAPAVISEVTVTRVNEYLEISVTGTALENKVNYVVSYKDNGAMIGVTKVVSGFALIKAENVGRVNIMSLSDTSSIMPVCENIVVEKKDFLTNSENTYEVIPG